MKPQNADVMQSLHGASSPSSVDEFDRINFKATSFSEQLHQLDVIADEKNCSLEVFRQHFIHQIIEKLAHDDIDVRNGAFEILLSLSSQIKQPVFQEELVEWALNMLEFVAMSKRPKHLFFAWVCGLSDAIELDNYTVLSVLFIISPHLAVRNKCRLLSWAIDTDNQSLQSEVAGIVNSDMIPTSRYCLNTSTDTSELILKDVVAGRSREMFNILIENAFLSLDTTDNFQGSLNLLCFILMQNSNLYEPIQHKAEASNRGDTIGRCQLNFFMREYVEVFNIRPLTPKGEETTLLASPK
jgi:hypothetical protein